MKPSHSTAVPPDESKHRWQFTLREILLVTLGLSVLLGTGRAFGLRCGLFELGLVILAGGSVLLAGICTRVRWPWLLGLVFPALGAWFLTPSGWPLGHRFLPAGLMSGVYAAAGVPVILVSRPGEKRWPWMLGAVACFLSPALVTPPDPFSTLIAAAPLCLCYTLVALAWRKRKSALLVMGPLFLLGGLGAVLASYFVAHRAGSHSTATPIVRQVAPETVDLLMSASAPVAQLGAVVTILAMLNRSRPEACPKE